MGLKGRLGVLRQQAGAVPSPTTDAPPSPTAAVGGTAGLAERLSRLRAPGTAPAPRRPREGEAELAARLGAEPIAPGCLLIERRIPALGRHGHAPLAAPPTLHQLPEAQGWRPAELVLLDTETTGLAGGSGTTVFLLGLARLVAGEWVTRQWLITRFAGERAMLAAAGAWCAEAQGGVSYNGRSFDLPLLAARCRLAGVADPFSCLPQLDLLHTTRRAFASRWPDCRLGTVERQLMGLRRSGDLPGSEAPAAWLDWLHAGDGGRLAEVVQHNHLDLLSLAALLPLMEQIYADPVAYGADLLTLARIQRRAGHEQRYRELLLRAEGRTAQLEQARLLRRQGEWEAACRLWRQLAAQGELEAVEALAKYYEHVAKAPAAAQQWAERLPAGPARDHRLLRLQRKRGGGRAPAAG